MTSGWRHIYGKKRDKKTITHAPSADHEAARLTCEGCGRVWVEIRLRHAPSSTFADQCGACGGSVSLEPLPSRKRKGRADFERAAMDALTDTEIAAALEGSFA